MKTTSMGRAILFLILAGVLASCGKGKCQPSSASGGNVSPFEIIDVRVGTGAQDLEHAKTVFRQDQKIWVSYDIRNITAMNTDKGPIFWVRQDVIVRDSKQNVVLLMPDVIMVKKALAQKPAKFVNELSLAGVKDLKEGSYTITLLATDLISFTVARKDIRIKISGSDSL